MFGKLKPTINGLLAIPAIPTAKVAALHHFPSKLKYSLGRIVATISCFLAQKPQHIVYRKMKLKHTFA